mmetsp:Transcript_3492/g.9577  ORF Transcript_3492/g.9577 Transcript_3492/m.9577 type:complete len:156 (-) Transcript_3492:25-492(-)
MRWGFVETNAVRRSSGSLRSTGRLTSSGYVKRMKSQPMRWTRRQPSESEHSVLSEHELEEKFEDLEYAQLARKMSRHMKLKARDVHGVEITDTFLGIDMVAHLLERRICDSQHEALYVCEQILHRRLIYRVHDEECDRFTCTFQPYKFAPSPRAR